MGKENDIGLRALKMGQNAWASSQPGRAAGAGPEVSANADSELLEKFHDRTSNPVDSATSGNVSAKLNEDSARYKKGPGPL